MAASIFDKIVVSSDEDLLALSKQLNESLEIYLRTQGHKLTPERRANIEESIGNVYDEVTKFVNPWEAVAPSGLATPSAGLKSPMLPPLSPLPRDDEVAALEAQVEEASRRVAEMRVLMQEKIQEKLQAKLANCRPTAEVTPPRPDPSEGSPSEGAMSPAADNLRTRLVEAAGKMPELMARLEEAQSRLAKVKDAGAGQINRKNPPNTIERAVLGAKRIPEEVDDEAGEAAQHEMSPALKEALTSGLVSTRRSRDLAPVPFPGGEIAEEGEQQGPTAQ